MYAAAESIWHGIGFVPVHREKFIPAMKTDPVAMAARIVACPMVADLFRSAAHHEKRAKCAPASPYRQPPTLPLTPRGYTLVHDPLKPCRSFHF